MSDSSSFSAMSNSTIASNATTTVAAAAVATTTAAAAATSSLGPITIGVSAAFGAMNFFFIGLRMYTRARISKDFGFNDVGMLIATSIYFGLFVLVVAAVNNGVGHHLQTSTAKDIENSLMFIFFLEVIYVVLTSIMKASLAITLLQWCKVKIHIRLLQAACLIDFVICIVVVEYFLAECAPISFTWTQFDPTAPKGTCLPKSQEIVVGMALSAVTISLDMLFLITPFWMMKGRGINNRLKMYIFALFGLGVAASIANFIRLAALVKLKGSTDALFDAAPVFLWSAVEVSIGIMVAGIVELRPLMKKYNVKGFEDSFERMEEDRQPIRLQSMDKGNMNISFPLERDMQRDGDRERGY